MATFKNLVGVTQPLPPPVGRELQWRVLAHMAMSYRSVTELEGLQLQLGVTGILPMISYAAAGTPAEPRSYLSYEDGRYVERPVNDGENSLDAKLRGFTPMEEMEITLQVRWSIGIYRIESGLGVMNQQR